MHCIEIYRSDSKLFFNEFTRKFLVVLRVEGYRVDRKLLKQYSNSSGLYYGISTDPHPSCVCGGACFFYFLLFSQPRDIYLDP